MKKEDLIEGNKYTFIGISIMATTAKREAVFVGFNTNGSMILNMRKLTAAGHYKHTSTMLLPWKNDFIVLDGFTKDHGIYTDSEVASNSGICFTADANYHLCAHSKESFESIVLPRITEEQRQNIVFYEMDYRNVRVDLGTKIFEREEVVICQ